MQSCDICRKRKVKCDRRAPCVRCCRLRQPCTYTDILRKKGPKFVHSYPSIYTTYTYTNTTTTPTSSVTLASASVSNSNEDLPLLTRGKLDLGMQMEMAGFMNADVDIQGRMIETGMGAASKLGEELELELYFGDVSPSAQQQAQQGPRLSLGPNKGPDSSLRVRGLVPSLGINNTLSLYVATLYPLFPVVDLCEIRLEFRFGLGYNSHSYGYSATRYALLCSLCAAVHANLAFSSGSSIQEEVEQDRGQEREHERVAENYLNVALQARAQYDVMPQDHPHHQHGRENSDDRERHEILTSFFLFMTYWSLRRETHAWWYLRECITLLLSSRMHREDGYRRLEPQEVKYRRIVFWGVFVAERMFCLLHDKPITLRPSIKPPDLPSVFNEEDVISGFVHLVTLFLGVNVDLSGCWTAAGFVTPITVSLATSAEHGHDGMNVGQKIQRLDLAITREWLRAKIWKLGIPGQRSSLEFVASNENNHWRFDEPLAIGKVVLRVLQTSSDALQDSWSGILDQKLCDICECLYNIQPVIQTRGKCGEVDLSHVFQGLLEVLSKVTGRSAYLLRHVCQRSQLDG